MFKVNNEDTITMSMTYFTPCSTVSSVNYEHVIAGWVRPHWMQNLTLKAKQYFVPQPIIFSIWT